MQSELKTGISGQTEKRASKPSVLDQTDLSREPLDMNRPWLEQLEERGLGDARTSELLEQKIYHNPGIMSLLEPTPTTTKG
jgi:hypothetical protein